MKRKEGDRRVFRYWVELRELASGSVRTLPLTAVVKICLARRKKNEPPVPNEEVLHLKDGSETLEVKSLDELRVRLREKYPDAAFERTLHYVRDQEAEERRERALDGVIDLLAKAAVDRLIEEEARGATPAPNPSARRGRPATKKQPASSNRAQPSATGRKAISEESAV